MNKTVKAISLILPFIIIFSCFTFLGSAALADESDIFSYNIVDKSAVLVGITNPAPKNIVVPDTLGGYPVTVIDGAFMNMTKVKSVVLPNSVTVITNKSFAYCKELSSITLSSGLAVIGDAAFRDCNALQSVDIPDGVTDIGNYAFAWCKDLKSVSLPQNLSRIKKGTFIDCTNLSDIEIPENVTYIEQDAITNTAYYNDEENWENDVLYLGKHLISAKQTVSGRCELRVDTKSISERAFGSCTLITELVMYKGIRIIGESVAYNCKNLTDIYYEGTVDDHKKIKISSGNSIINNATWHYKYDPNVKEYKPGDINGDELINNKDVLRLFKYLSGWEVTVMESTLDVNGDKANNNLDLLRLFQYVSGWDVKIYSENVGENIGGGDHGPVISF